MTTPNRPPALWRIIIQSWDAHGEKSGDPTIVPIPSNTHTGALYELERLRTIAPLDVSLTIEERRKSGRWIPVATVTAPLVDE